MAAPLQSGFAFRQASASVGSAGAGSVVRRPPNPVEGQETLPNADCQMPESDRPEDHLVETPSVSRRQLVWEISHFAGE